MTCAHHYDLEAPNGATSRGVCRLCGEVREFRNVSPDNIVAPTREDAKELMGKRAHAARGRAISLSPAGGVGA